jgi:stage II sporulation protein GA (sporulation sigma-E factor processing peptidase)
MSRDVPTWSISFFCFVRRKKSKVSGKFRQTLKYRLRYTILAGTEREEGSSLVVYADVVFFTNSYIDFLLLWLTSGIRRQKTPMWRLIVAAVLGGLYSTLYLWSAFSLAYFFPVKIIVSFFMIGIAFGFKHPLGFFRNLGMFYLVCFIVGGGLIAVHYVMTGEAQVAGGIFFTESAYGWGSPVSWALILFGFPLVWLYTRYALRSLNERHVVHQFLTEVRIRVGNHEILCTGLVDTGNQLRDPITRAPVMMIELEQLKDWLPPEMNRMVTDKDFAAGWMKLSPDWLTRIRVVPFRAAGKGNGLMVAIKPDQVCVWQANEWNKIEKVLIGIDVGRLSSDGTYQAIIHPSCLSTVHS